MNGYRTPVVASPVGDPSQGHQMPPSTAPADQPTPTADASAMSINVPPELQDQVAAWQDGQDYQITVNQTGANAFDLVSIDSGGDENAADSPGAGPTEDVGPEARNPGISGSLGDTGGTTIPTSKNNSVNALLLMRRAKKK